MPDAAATQDLPQRGTKQQHMLQLLDAAGAAGMLSAVLARNCGMQPNNTSSLLSALERRGVVGRWPDPHYCASLRVRWWLRCHLPRQAPPPTGEPLLQSADSVAAVRRRLKRAAAAKPGRGRDLQSIKDQTEGLKWRDFGPANAGGRKAAARLSAAAAAVVLPLPKVQVCPSPDHDARYQLPPGARVYGAGFAAAGVGRDATTGKPWGAR
jgi:hypothetical protein